MNQKLHRWINSVLTATVLGVLLTIGIHAKEAYYDLRESQGHQSEMAQIVSDEGFKGCTYKDNHNFDTIGFGHLVKSDENFECITAQTAMKLLQEDYFYAWETVSKDYPWAEGEVKLVLTNMCYQLGRNGLSKFKKTLDYLEKERYTDAAMEMIDSSWHKQTQRRSMRLAIRILSLEGY